MARLMIKIHGIVQGVTYRYSTQKEAIRLEINGWVRNNPDETVEIVAEGQKKSLEELIEWCKFGPEIAKVEKIEIEWQTFKNEFNNFVIKY